VVCYRIAAGRGFDDAAAVLRVGFAGVLERDGWTPYRKFTHAVHQSCVAHLLRRVLELLADAKRGQAKNPHAVGHILGVPCWSATGVPPASCPRPRRRPRRSGSARQWTNSSPGGRPTRLTGGCWTISAASARRCSPSLAMPGVQATSWRAEHAIRPAVVCRTQWGGNATWDGAACWQALAAPRPATPGGRLLVADHVRRARLCVRLNRYSIRDRTEGLAYNADGSLDLYLQQDSPERDRAANWLPAPAGQFRPILRMYNPRPEAFDDRRWQLPAIQRQRGPLHQEEPVGRRCLSASLEDAAALRCRLPALLAEVVETEPPQPKDAVMLAMPASIGIEKGKPFEPDDERTELLSRAVHDGVRKLERNAGARMRNSATSRDVDRRGTTPPSSGNGLVRPPSLTRRPTGTAAHRRPATDRRLA
jgi:Protein of unknown function (DUF1214)/Transposase IS66 family